MNPQFTTGVFNQQRWPQAGDTDDCWAIADLMAVHSVAPWLPLPGITKYREAAEIPAKSARRLEQWPTRPARSGLSTRLSAS